MCQQNALLYQTDFGLKDGAVAAMKGVAYNVSPQLSQFDLTHDITPYNIWEGAWRLRQAILYWPAGTVFVSVVDPGVGSDRRSVAATLKTGQIIITPDNGTLTLVADEIGIAELRLVDEVKNRLPGSADSYTFHGRDLYAYTGARLAAGKIRFSELGNKLDPVTAIKIPYQKAQAEGAILSGNIPVLDEQYGNIWTNIPLSLIRQQGWKYGDSMIVRIRKADSLIYSGIMMYGTTFSAVERGKAVAYINSLLKLSFGINMGDFAGDYHLDAGAEWSVTVSKVQ